MKLVWLENEKKLHEAFGNPIVIDEEQVLKLWNMAAVWITVFAFVGILIWNSLVRFIYIVLIGLVMWGIVSIKIKGVGFSPILITGIYANVPVIYLLFFLKRVNLNFFSLYTILLIAIWSFALRAVLREPDGDRGTTDNSKSDALEA